MTSAPLLDLRFTVAEMPKARRRVAACVQSAGLHGPRSEDFVLAVNEVMGNAIQHAGGSGLIRVYRDHDAVRCVVTDSGPGVSQEIPLTLPSLDSAGSGRGLWLARELTDILTISANGHGTAVTLQIRVAGTLSGGVVRPGQSAEPGGPAVPGVDDGGAC